MADAEEGDVNSTEMPPKTLTHRIATGFGLARSLLIYRGLPWRRLALKRFYASLIKPGDLVFDIGAHAGNRTATVLALGARCISVEPQPAFARLLSALYGQNERVTLVICAVGSQPGTAKLNISSRHPTVSSLSMKWIEQVGSTRGFEQVRWDTRIDVPVTTLDALIEKHGAPAFCKIDVEGMEADILRGLSTAIPLIAVEYLPAAMDVAQECVERIEALGSYEYNYSSGESHAMISGEWLDSGALLAALSKAQSSGDIYARRISPAHSR